MVKRHAPKDLFGRPVRQRRPRYEATLEKADKRMLSERAARARWLAEVVPKRTYFGMPIETFYVLDETTSSFIYGNYVAVIVLATSFVEHWFTAQLSERGYQKEAARGLSASIQTARSQNLVDVIILDKADGGIWPGPGKPVYGRQYSDPHPGEQAVQYKVTPSER